MTGITVCGGSCQSEFDIMTFGADEANGNDGGSPWVGEGKIESSTRRDLKWPYVVLG